MSGDERRVLELTLAMIEAMCTREPDDGEWRLDPRMARIIAEAAHGPLHRRWRALNGRPGASRVGEMVQAFVDAGFPQIEARREVRRRLAIDGIEMKLESIAAAHRRFRETSNKGALLYRTTRQPP